MKKSFIIIESKMICMRDKMKNKLDSARSLSGNSTELISVFARPDKSISSVR